jgi:GntR family transcriptional repressor for pyruvate dehydrogenase complex
MLEKLESKKKSIHVVEQLLQAIGEGEYKVGDKLPSEERIATMTGVSRPPVRQALGSLALVGIVETRPGDGTYVKSATAYAHLNQSQILAMLKPGKNPFEALEVRRALETGVVGYAIDRSTPEDLEELGEDLKRITRSIGDGNYDDLLKADMDFHMSIGKATKNFLIEQIYSSLWEIMKQDLWRDLKKGFLAASETHLQETLDLHTEIYKAICDGDKNEALEAIERHFDDIEKLFFERR